MQHRTVFVSYFIEIQIINNRLLPICRCNIYTYYLNHCVCCLISACYEIYIALCKIFGGLSRDCIFTKKPIKSAKTHFFRIFSIFAFRCMVKWSLIGTEISPVIAVKFSGLV